MPGPTLDDLAHRNVPYVGGGQVPTVPESSALDRVMRIEEEELAQRRLRSTMELRDLEDQVRVAELNSRIAKLNGGNGQVVDQQGKPVAKEEPQGLITEVFGFFAAQNQSLQEALREKDSEATTSLRDELKAMREQMGAIASGTSGQGAMGQLQLLRDVIKFQSDLQAEVKALQPEPQVPASVSKTQEIIAYEDAMTRRKRADLEFEMERDKWKEEVRQFNMGMAQSAQRMGYVIGLANRHIPDIVAAVTGKISGQAVIPPPPPPPPPELGPPAAPDQVPAASQPPPPPPQPPLSGLDQLILTECPNCHRRFGVAPGQTSAKCPYADCVDEELELTPMGGFAAATSAPNPG